MEMETEKGTVMDRHLLERASRMFNSIADLRTEEDRSINDWFKEQLAAHERCARCGAIADSDIHYIGTVDSHEFVRPEPSTGETRR